MAFTPRRHLTHCTYSAILSTDTSTRGRSVTGRAPINLRQGTLDLLILRVLTWGPTHGHDIVKGIQRASDEALLIDHGSLYPTLQRLEKRRLITADWGTSANGRKARYYRLTTAGRTALAAETSRWTQLTAAVGKVLGATAPSKAK
jgi:PadR family transcriptional regulator PadR